MLAFVLRRLFLAVSIVFGISVGAFFSFGLSFDPTYPYALDTSEAGREQRQQLIAHYHLHDPIFERYWLWLRGLFTHGFGDAVLGPRGFGLGNAIGPAVWSAAGVTAQLIAVSLVLVVLGSVLVGVTGARWPRTLPDALLRLLAYVAWSMPTFLVGVLLLRWLGPTGWFFTGKPGGGLVHWVRTMTLPALTLALGLIGVYSRYIRSAMLVSLRQPYAVVARAKGLSERRVVLRHALRNSLIPFVSVLSIDFAAVVGASLATDYVFGMGGLAGLFLQSLGQADPFEMTAILVVIGGIVAVFMFLTDLAVGWLDPRARIAGAR
jgi:ABC-type dipeptide/oligopeptide/nickel transport system permease component